MRTELKKKLSYYSLRHFGITARLNAGVSIWGISRIAGTGVAFIEQHYGHLDKNDAKRGI